MTREPVCRQSVTVNLKSGLHLRPISQIAEAARRFQCDVRISKASATVDAKSVLDLLTLHADFGTQLTIEASGADAADAVEQLTQLFERNFDVDEV
jgi:phosphotransferase system HPr (HPr) family protein